MTIAPRLAAIVASALIAANGALLLIDRGHDPVSEFALEGRAEPVVATAASVVAIVHRADDLAFAIAAGGRLSLPEVFPAGTVALLASDGASYALAVSEPGNGTTRLVSIAASPVSATVPGVARTLAISGSRVALATEGAPHQVHVLSPGGGRETINLTAPANALALSGSQLAIGTSAGPIELRGTRSGLIQTAYAAADLALSENGERLLVGGRGLEAALAAGAAMLFDLTDPAFRTPKWAIETGAATTIVALSPDGNRALAFSEVPSAGTLVAIDAASGQIAWTHRAPGTVARLGIGGQGGVAMTADLARIAVATLDGDVTLLDGDGRVLWKSFARGATSLSISGETLAANAKLPRDADYARLAVWALDREPVWQNVVLTLPLANLVIATGATAAHLAGRRR